MSAYLALVGPTASGKSALALEVARRWPDVEIISIDSMQVYRKMDIGTGKPTMIERAAVPHHMLDLVDPSDPYSVARFQAEVDATIRDVEARHGTPLLVGGTGLYFRAAVDGLTIPAEYPDARAEIEADPDTVALHKQLEALDPVAAARMEPTNRRRVVRALEVTLGSGHPFSSYGPGLDDHPPTRFALAGVWLPRGVVARRVEERVDAMLAAGLVEEVAALARRPDGLSRTARQALGYKELLDHVAGRVPLDEARALIVRRTRRFARRQRVWFRRDPRIVWHGAGANPLAALPALLGDWEARCQR